MGRKKGAVWEYFKSEGKSATCKYCNTVYKVVNATKMLNHIKKCIKCPLKLRKKFDAQSDKNQQHLATSAPSPQCSTLETPSTSGLHHRSDSNTRTSRSHSSLYSFMDNISTNEQKNINEMLARAIFVSGTPFSIVNHPLWLQLFSKLRPSYKPPSRTTISTTYLNAEYNDIKNKVTELLNEAKTLNLQCDGWSNIRNEGILNFVVTTPKPVFVDFINTKSNRHTGEYLANEIDKILLKYEPNKFFVIIGDNAANVKKAFKILKERYPHLISLGCLAHTLHLLCNDILQCSTICKFLSKVIELIKKIRGSQILTALFVKINEEKNCKTSLKLPCKTRWGSYLQCLESMLKCKVTLQNLAVNEEASTILGREIKTLILDDDIFWVRVEKVSAILKPICSWITKLEGDKPLIQKAHQAFFEISDSLQTALPESPLTKIEEVQLLKIIKDRKDFAIGAIHLAATLLDPTSQGHNLSAEEQLDAIEFIDKLATETENIDDKKVMADLAAYRSKDEGMWAKDFLWKSVDKMTPIVWWKGMCNSSPLSEIAIKILSAPITSSATERTFSTFSWVHNKRRNRLTAERAGKVTYIAHNWKLLNPENKSNNDPKELESASAIRENEADIQYLDEDMNISTPTSKRKRIEYYDEELTETDYEESESESETEIQNLYDSETDPEPESSGTNSNVEEDD